LAGQYKTVDESNSSAERQKQFTELFNLHYPKVAAYVRRRLGPAASDDAVADTFLAAWINLEQRPNDALLWLYGLARGAVSHHRRRIARIERMGERAASLRPMLITPDHSEIAGWQDPFSTSFDRLTETEREVLRVTAWEGLGASEGAVVLGCSVSAFKVRLHRARRHLRQLLADEGAERPGESGALTHPRAAHVAHQATTPATPPTAMEIS
jgi:RNA polymerase sigma-70 factor (ECF subfamily)